MFPADHDFVRDHRCAPAFDYARATHTTEMVRDESQTSANEFDKKKVLFTTKDLAMDLRTIVSGENMCDAKDEPDAEPLTAAEKFDQGKNELDGPGGPEIDWQELDLSKQGHKGKGVWSEFEVCEGEVVTFIVSRPLISLRSSIFGSEVLSWSLLPSPAVPRGSGQWLREPADRAGSAADPGGRREARRQAVHPRSGTQQASRYVRIKILDRCLAGVVLTGPLASQSSA